MHSQRKPITVANASRLERVRQFGPPSSIRSRGHHLAFDSRSTLLVAQAQGQPERIRWWDVRGESGLPVCSPELPLGPMFCVLPGRELVVAVGEPDVTAPAAWKKRLVALSTRDGSLRNEAPFPHYLSGMSASADGSLLAMTVDDGKGLLWDVERWRPLREMEAPPKNFYSQGCAISPDGRFIAAAQSHNNFPDEGSGTLQLWDATTGATLCLLSGNDPYVWDVAFHPTEPLLAAGTNGHGIHVVDLEQRRIVRTMDCPRAWRLSFSPDGSLLAVALDGPSFSVYRFDTGEHLFSHEDNNDEQTSTACFSPDGTYVAWGQGDYTLGLWAVAD
ncbi:WD40 repeat domain-containing protein [Archangium gephyra]|uniref:WD40 repeat domain-containing protein n=1 Tax=Archangium gephyra TaxID=48 RepID=UPI003B7A6689